MNIKGKKVGLALGGGGARGWAHIGVINAVRELGIPIHCVAGTSMGALVGAAFTSGKIDELHQVALDLDWKRMLYYFTELSFPRMGLIDGTRIVELVKEHSIPSDIRDLPLPFAAVATDVLTGKEVVLEDGSISEAVRASIAIPGIFTPVARGEELLVDGGLVNPLPVNIATRMGADFVIAVDVTGDLALPSVLEDDDGPEQKQEKEEVSRTEPMKNWLERINEKFNSMDFSGFPAPPKWFPGSGQPNIFDISGNSIRIIERQVTEMRLKIEAPDILIQPIMPDVGVMEFHKARPAIDAGYAAAMGCLSATDGPTDAEAGGGVMGLLRKVLPHR